MEDSARFLYPLLHDFQVCCRYVRDEWIYLDFVRDLVVEHTNVQYSRIRETSCL